MVGGALLAAAPAADAALTLTISEPTMPGLAPLVIPDLSGTGIVQYVGPYGDFTTNIVFGVSNRTTTPTPTVAQLQIQSLDIKNVSTSPTAATLKIIVSDSGFTFPNSSSSDVLSGTLAGTLTGASAGDNVTFSSSAQAAGNPTASTVTSSFTAGAASVAPISFSQPTNSATFLTTTSYTLSNTTTATLTGSGTTANLSGSSTVVAAIPEPASIGLAAAGLGLAAVRRRRPVAQ